MADLPVRVIDERDARTLVAVIDFAIRMYDVLAESGTIDTPLANRGELERIQDRLR
jgi:hypothetical protein